MAGWNRQLVLRLSSVATTHVVAAPPGMAFPIKTNSATACQFLSENTTYDDGNRIVVRSLHNCWSKCSGSEQLKGMVFNQGTADKTLSSDVSMRCDTVKAKIKRKSARQTTPNATEIVSAEA